MFGPHDGTRVAVHPYRRMMPVLMRGRNESAVYFEQQLDVTRTLAWLAERNARGGPRVTVFHVVLHALASVLHERARLNRFTIGHRIYQRRDVLLSFAAKKAMSDDAPLATIKRRFAPGETFADLVAALDGHVTSARDHQPSAMDKELAILTALPGFLLIFLIAVLRRLYAWGLAPRSLVDTDPMYASAFVANLGSIKIDAPFHHLYEHGNCPLFVAIGQVTPTPFVDGDRLATRSVLTIRYTFDERVEDGLYCATALRLLQERVEDPARWLGDAPAAFAATS